MLVISSGKVETMAYTDKNYKSKKALKDDLAAGARVHCYQPGGMFPLKAPGRISLEGPHYPEPHKWYASATVDADGYIVGKVS